MIYDVILFHVYRAVDSQPDQEGYLGGLCLATLLAYQKLQAEINGIEFKPPIIVFGADLRETTSGTPLFEIYKRDFVNHAFALGLSENDFKLFQPENFSFPPVGTKTELELFSSVIKAFKKEGGKHMILCREPHLPRIKYLSKVIGIEPVFETHESIIWSLLWDEPRKYYDDTETFKKAERIKMLFMNCFDRNGNFLEWFSRFAPRTKDWLLSSIGHRN